jgi:Uncharacterised protein conserved in bacteria (DUF2326)
MLIEIVCDKFKEEQIEFRNGLNVILGDSVATNSIGKSTLLMVLDFIFGGSTFIEHNSDVVDELGHHDYKVKFLFKDSYYLFKRGTFTPDLVYKCSEGYEEIEPISIEEYRSFLKANYNIDKYDISFRAFVSLFSRIWGKNNLDVKRPLNAHQNQKAVDCVDNTIKMFNMYQGIRQLSEDLKIKIEENSALTKAFKKKIIPKINKKQYKKNLKIIEDIHREINDIRNNLAKYAININEIVDREVLELKEQKDKLLMVKSNVNRRLNRVRSNLGENKYIKSKHLDGLRNYFPDVNTDKLADIEVFHSDITIILRSELRASEKDLREQLVNINQEIKNIDEKISNVLSKVENPSVIVDRVYDLSNTHKKTSIENKYYDDESTIKENVKSAKERLTEEKFRISKHISNILNNKVRNNVTHVYNEKRKSPSLELGFNNYKFEIHEDTGTGKAYSNLLLLDLAFFETTALPIVIHDSLLFKNIENEAVSNFIFLYNTFNKQSFIAIDEIQKYGEDTEKKLLAKKVIELSNKKVLYIKDWRR